MKTKSFFSALVIVAGVLTQVHGASPPNIVLIVSDDQGYGCLLYTSPSPRA